MKRYQVVESNPTTAIEKLATAIKIPDQAALIFFCSADYAPEVVSRELNRHFDCTIIGCSSAGEIGDQYQAGGIVGLALSKDEFDVSAEFIPQLSSYDANTAQDVVNRLTKDFRDGIDSQKTFAFCLVDGLSIKEEAFVAHTYGVMPSIPLIGGSAGDNLKFEKTTIYCNDNYGSNAAALALFKTDVPFEVFEVKHIRPTDLELVITSADPGNRTVFEIDGGPAAEEYANLLGLELSELTPDVFSTHPVMLQIGDDWHVRSIQKANPDKSLTFYCAIDEGIPLSIGKGEEFTKSLSTKLVEMEQEFDEIVLTIGCDCILRRLEIEQKQITEEVESILQKLKFFGFSTFGEQVNAIHVNQTLTGVVLGRR